MALPPEVVFVQVQVIVVAPETELTAPDIRLFVPEDPMPSNLSTALAQVAVGPPEAPPDIAALIANPSAGIVMAVEPGAVKELTLLCGVTL